MISHTSKVGRHSHHTSPPLFLTVVKTLSRIILVLLASLCAPKTPTYPSTIQANSGKQTHRASPPRERGTWGRSQDFCVPRKFTVHAQVSAMWRWHALRLVPEFVNCGFRWFPKFVFTCCVSRRAGCYCGDETSMICEDLFDLAALSRRAVNVVRFMCLWGDAGEHVSDGDVIAGARIKYPYSMQV